MTDDPRAMRLQPQPLTLSQALAIAILALEHVETCGDDETHSCRRARLLLALQLRQQHAITDTGSQSVDNRDFPA